MARRLLEIFCVLCLVAASYGRTDEAGNDKNYDLEGKITERLDEYENSLLAKKHNFLNQFKFRGINEDGKFEPTGNLLQNSSKCMGDLLYAIQNIKSQWAMQMFDSFGKPESGILQGNMKWLGSYNECLGVRATNPNDTVVGNFRGKYCFANLPFSMQEGALTISISTAVCIPDSCSPEDLQEGVLQILQIGGIVPGNFSDKFTLSKIKLQCKPVERHLNSPAKWMIALLAIFFALTVAGSSITAAKYFKKIIENFGKRSSMGFIADNSNLIEDQNDTTMKKDVITLQGDSPGSINNSVGGNDVKIVPLQDNLPETRNKDTMHSLESFLTCFCVFTNGSKLLNTNTSEGELLCVHGIRFLSMAWVILGHTYLFGIVQTKNMAVLLTEIKTVFSEIIFQGFYSVDSFFVLSGFLMAYLAMNEMNKTKGRIAWHIFYIHRYIRLTPTYMLILGFYATVFRYMGSGPYWADGDIDTNCQSGWWKNLLYINNFNDQAEQCMGWAWYLANDMQFFVISPLFLITLYRWPKVAFALIGAFVLACWVSNFYITYHFELMAGVINVSQAMTASLIKYMEYFNKIYIKPWTRISPYLIGMLTGYFLHKRKESNQPRHSLLFLCVGWSLSVGIGLICVFVLYRQNPPLIGNCFYNAFNRTAFAMSLSWVIYACLIGEGGFVNRILSYKVFIPLSRLTYVAYLIHSMIVTGYFTSIKTAMEFSHPTFVYLFLGFLFATYLISLPVALMLESPVMAIEKWIRKRNAA